MESVQEKLLLPSFHRVPTLKHHTMGKPWSAQQARNLGFVHSPQPSASDEFTAESDIESHLTGDLHQQSFCQPCVLSIKQAVHNGREPGLRGREGRGVLPNKPLRFSTVNLSCVPLLYIVKVYKGTPVSSTYCRVVCHLTLA